jgi:hypothetical protein
MRFNAGSVLRRSAVLWQQIRLPGLLLVMIDVSSVQMQRPDFSFNSRKNEDHSQYRQTFVNTAFSELSRMPQKRI